MPTNRMQSRSSPIRLDTAGPFHLEATVRLLQRRPINRVDIWQGDRYLRLLELGGDLLLVSVANPGTVAQPLLCAVVRHERPTAAERKQACAILRRTLGLDQPPVAFEWLASKDPRLQLLIRTLHGMRPPRYPTLFEAIANVIPFQQVSLDAGAAIMVRMVERFGRNLKFAGRTWFAFPEATSIAGTTVAELKGIGLSGAKARSLHELARRVVQGALSEERFAALSTEDALQAFMDLPGIGPWSAGVLLLRGLGRMDAFPSGDVGVARGLARLLGLPADRLFAYEDYVAGFGKHRGYLYFYNLGAQLLERGLIHPAFPQESRDPAGAEVERDIPTVVPM